MQLAETLTRLSHNGTGVSEQLYVTGGAFAKAWDWSQLASCKTAPFSPTLDMSFSDFYPSDLSDITSSSEEDEPPAKVKKPSARKTRPDQKQPYTITQALRPPRSTSYSVRSLYDVVWAESKQIGLIDSVIRNYYIPPLIFAVSTAQDGSETRICIDGKQRLTSIQTCQVYGWPCPGGAKVTNASGGRPWDLGPFGPTCGVVCHSGVVVFTDPMHFHFRFLIETISPQNVIGGRNMGQCKGLLPKTLQQAFANKQIVCVEYDGLTSEQDVKFSKFVFGSFLVRARSPTSVFSVSSSSQVLGDDGFGHSFDWGRARGKDFHGLALSSTSSSNFRREPFAQRVSPIEFVMIGVMIYVKRETLSLTQLSHAVEKMRADVRSAERDVRTNGRTTKLLFKFIMEKLPKLALRSDEQGDKSAQSVLPTLPRALTSSPNSSPHLGSVPQTAASGAREATSGLASAQPRQKKRKRQMEEEDGDNDSEPDEADEEYVPSRRYTRRGSNKAHQPSPSPTPDEAPAPAPVSVSTSPHIPVNASTTSTTPTPSLNESGPAVPPTTAAVGTAEQSNLGRVMALQQLQALLAIQPPQQLQQLQQLAQQQQGQGLPLTVPFGVPHSPTRPVIKAEYVEPNLSSPRRWPPPRAPHSLEYRGRRSRSRSRSRERGRDYERRGGNDRQSEWREHTRRVPASYQRSRSRSRSRSESRSRRGRTPPHSRPADLRSRIRSRSRSPDRGGYHNNGNPGYRVWEQQQPRGIPTGPGSGLSGGSTPNNSGRRPSSPSSMLISASAPAGIARKFEFNRREREFGEFAPERPMAPGIQMQGIRGRGRGRGRPRGRGRGVFRGFVPSTVPGTVPGTAPGTVPSTAP
ncbi:hypothetical protein EI94DRAFT_1703872 [Lactarius quietus]|nr:hypothetical protein EI94DRAFT_1703872 [Lactarius quietus]